MKAAMVIGWLGPAADWSDDALTLVDWIAKECMIQGSGEEGWDQDQMIMSGLSAKYAGSYDQLYRIIESVGALFTRKFWFRVWILQEGGLLKTF